MLINIMLGIRNELVLLRTKISYFCCSFCAIRTDMITFPSLYTQFPRISAISELTLLWIHCNCIRPLSLDWWLNRCKFVSYMQLDTRLTEIREGIRSAWNGQMNVQAWRGEAEQGVGKGAGRFLGHLRMLKMQFKMIYVFVVWTTECWGHRKCYELLPLNYNWLPSAPLPPSYSHTRFLLHDPAAVHRSEFALSNRELIKWRQWKIYDSFDGRKGARARDSDWDTGGVRGRFDKVFVCANSLYSVVRQAQQWKLPLEPSAGEEGFKAIYTKNKKNGKAMHSSAAREANPSSTGTGTSTGTSPNGIPHCCWQATALQLHFLIAGAWVSVPSPPCPNPD